MGTLAFHFPLSIFCLLLFLAALLPAPALAQTRPYIGFVYPAGGQQGTTVQVRVGGQDVDEATGLIVTGPGVTVHLSENYRRLNNQEMQLLNEQLRVLKRENLSDASKAMLMDDGSPAMMMALNAPSTNEPRKEATPPKPSARQLIDKIERRTLEYVAQPACPSIASLLVVEVTIAPDAEPGPREIRVVSLRGVSNPLPFHIGQLPEHARKPMITATKQVLGKEAQALRKRLPSEAEERVDIPCTVNGQIASGEVNRYRFQARKDQRLVMTALARQLVPFIADAVPGWFQPVLVLYDGAGNELAYDDDYRFKPDPTFFYQVPKDGEYVLEVHDSLYRGREDFVYRISIGELPFITSVYPLGGPAAQPVAAGVTPEALLAASAPPQVGTPRLTGWNLDPPKLIEPSPSASPAISSVAVRSKALISNRIPFALDILPEVFEQEPNNTPDTAQQLHLPVIVNGRIDRAGDWDVFLFTGKANEVVVAEVQARRLESPLDSVLKLTDSSGKMLAFNDDHEDLADGLNTHQADSYFVATLPADGTYYVHLGDTARQGGPEYGYRLRLSPPQPDFQLRVVPSSASMRSKGNAIMSVYAQRKDGFTGPIRVSLKNPPPGFSAVPITLSPTQTVARFSIKTTLLETPQPIALSIVGSSKSGDEETTREAVAAEDKMQAFLWRHLVPANDLRVLVFDPIKHPPARRLARIRPTPPPATKVSLTNVVGSTNSIAGTNSAGGTNTLAAAPAPKFTKQQVAARLRQLASLFDEGMLTDDFYNEKVEECESNE